MTKPAPLCMRITSDGQIMHKAIGERLVLTQ